MGAIQQLILSLGGVDPYWSNVVSLLHFEGVNAGTTFTDQKAHTWTPAGNAQTSTSIKKFGDSSGLFDGNGDIVTSESSSDFAFGTGDFTIEFWYNPSASAASVDYICSTTFINSTNYVAIGYDPSTDRMRILANNVTTTSNGVTTPPSVFTHIALVRSSGVLQLYSGGVGVLTPVAHTTNYPAGSMYVGGVHSSIASAINWGHGNIDDFRVTKGVARYTSNFTPPTEQFPNS